MSRERFQRARSLFEQACNLPPVEQKALLDEACADDAELRRELEVLLAADRTPVSDLDTPLPDQLPERIGGYRIVGVIGQGGMGTVYEAEQESPRRRVALKLISFATPELLKRFEYEAEILGRLSHPGIAKIIEAGVADGRPYFAMELIEGAPLTDFVRRAKLGTRQRLELLARIADAVQHAHLQGVVHRDLKPGNILVEQDGTPRLLDFGVAKLTTPDARLTTLGTRAGQLLGTLPYMSPEQFTSDPIDVRADVYALGVIGFELLTGKTPKDFSGKSLPEAIALAQTGDMASLGTRGDAETIIGKALQPDKERRYGSAGELADDLRRFLRDEPIVARPPSASYQLRKMARRHRAVFGGVTVALLAIVVGGVVSLSLYFTKEEERERAVAARQVAEEERARADVARQLAEDRATTRDEIVTFLVGLFDVVDPSEARGRTVTAKEILDEGARVIETSLDTQPEVRTQLMLHIGRIYLRLGLVEQAARMIEESVTLRTELYGAGSPELGPALIAASNLAVEQGEFDRAVTIAEQAVATGYDRTEALQTLGVAQNAVGDDAAAEKSFRESLALRETNMARHGLAAVLLGQAKFEEAEKVAREALSISIQQFGDLHPDVVTRRFTLGEVLREKGDFDRAEAELIAALEAQEKLTGPDSVDVSNALNNLAIISLTRADYTRARPLLERALAISLRWRGADHPHTIAILANLGAVETSEQNLEKAIDHYRKALVAQRKISGNRHPNVGIYLTSIGTLLGQLNRLDEAETFLNEALERLPGYLGTTEHPDYSTAVLQLALIKSRRGDLRGANELSERAYGIVEKIYEKGAPEVGDYLYQGGRILLRMGQHAEAKRRLDRALVIFDKHFAATNPTRLGCLETLAAIETELGNFDRADQLLAEVISLQEQVRGRDSDDVKQAVSQRARIGQLRGHYVTARTAYARLMEDPPKDPIRLITLQNNYALVLLLLRDVKTAEPIFRDARQRFIAIAGDAHPAVGTLTHNIAECMRLSGQESEAEFRAALKIYMAASATGESPMVANTLTKLGQARGDRAILDRALAMRRKLLPEGHPDIAKSLVAIGDEPSLAEAVAIFTAAMPDSPLTAAAKSDWAARLIEAGRTDDARKLLTAAIAVLTTGFGEDHPDTAAARKRLAGLD